MWQETQNRLVKEVLSELKIKIGNKKDVLPEANDLEVVEINEGDLAFGNN